MVFLRGNGLGRELESETFWEEYQLVIIIAASVAGALLLCCGCCYRLNKKTQLLFDLRFAKRVLAVKKTIRDHVKQNHNVAAIWYDVLKKNPKKDCMIMDDHHVTFAQVEARSNQVGHWLLEQGVQPGDTVALFMNNRPEFVISWLGMTKIGAKVAMINTAVKQESLLHCIKISGCNVILCGSELADTLGEIKSGLDELKVSIFASGGAKFNSSICKNVDADIASQAEDKHDPELTKDVGMLDDFGYIYTSGTTGMPKAAVIMHQKVVAFGALLAKGFLVRETDIVYGSGMPLFHSAGGGLGVGIMLFTGCTLVIREKFSAREFWKDCVKHRCTVVQYIGELCKYLLLTPESPDERRHCVRIAIGNGLRPEIWGEFQDRFDIPEIGEFYGATEGNGALINHCTTKQARGAVGRMGSLVTKITGFSLVKFDVVEEEPVRNAKGFCIPCKPGEPGELLFPIKEKDPSTKFAGYNDKKATQKKIITDVFEKGDKFFRTGDLLMRDKNGYYFFVDRIGDTFRWRGENCSTTEVTQVMSKFPGVEECNVYGVQIPNNMDGRAPMCCLKLQDPANFDFKSFAEHGLAKLPPYAVPLFLRVQVQFETTATMKHQKVKLRNEGIDISKVNDKLYWLNKENKQYEELSESVYRGITEGKIRI